MRAALTAPRHQRHQREDDEQTDLQPALGQDQVRHGDRQRENARDGGDEAVHRGRW